MTNPLIHLAVYCFAKRNEGSWFWDKMYRLAFRLKLWRFL